MSFLIIRILILSHFCYDHSFDSISLMFHSSFKKWALRGTYAVSAIAIYQGNKARNEYCVSKRLVAPEGPKFGVEKWLNELNNLKTKFKTTTEIILHEKDTETAKIKKYIDEFIRKTKDKLINQVSTTTTVEHEIVTTSNKGKIKLLLIGDSLACGIGCEDKHDNSLVFPQMVAKVLSIALQQEVNWLCCGKVGATAKQLHSEVLPQQKNEIIKLLSDSYSPDDKLIVIVLCGLNDWRSMLESFPFGKGLESFRSELKILVDDIKVIASDLNCSCDVYLPAIPIKATASDPNSFFTTRPLKDVVEFISWLWDMQKQALARDDSEVSIII